MPMFPLGSVLFPTMILPLHVFEERYRRLVDDCLNGDREFGVCLIERGMEVGGGDVRTDVGTVAQIVDAHRFDDGRWALATVGTRRLRILEWLDDAPFPCATVVDWPDERLEPSAEQGDAGRGVDLAALRATSLARLRQVLALQAELGDPAPPATTDVDVDPALASYQMATLSPAGAFDRQRLLAASSVERRLVMLDEVLADAETLLRHRIAGA